MSKHDILDEMTRDELIRWIRGYVSPKHRPSRIHLLYLRCDQKSEKLRADYKAENERWQREAPDYKKRDELVVQFNQTADPNEKLRLAGLISEYEKPLLAHIERRRKLDRKQSQLNRLYDLLEIEKSKPRAAS